jgi:uncharacterized membrane protein YagU involved in acid resistance
MLGGAVAGAVATVVMSVHMLGRPSVDRIGTPPPQRIVSQLLPREPVPARRAWAVALHLGIGASAGVVYALTRRHRGPLSGALFGLAVWAVGYEVLVPLIGVLPPAHDDDPGRRAALLQAHLVYGAMLGAVAR